MSKTLTDLTSVKLWCGIANTSKDAVITTLINSCSQELINYMNRTIYSEARTEIRDGNGKNTMTLAHYPLTAILSVIVNGIEYKEIQQSDRISKGVKIIGERRILAQGFVFTKGISNVELFYVGGYSVIPDAIKQACNELVAMRLKNERDDRQGVSSKSLAGESVSFFHGQLPNSVVSALTDFIDVVPL
jgi:hypothetical protein